MTTQLDQYEDGDTVTLEIVRYGEIMPVSSGMSLFDLYMGGSGSSSTLLAVNGGYEIIKVEVTLRYMD